MVLGGDFVDPDRLERPPAIALAFAFVTNGDYVAPTKAVA